MNRRLFILSSSSSLISIAHASPPEVLKPKLSFRLEDGEKIYTEIVVAGELIYALAKGGARTFNVACVNARGERLWSRALPEGLFTQLNVGRRGQIILLRRGGPGRTAGRFEHLRFEHDLQSSQAAPLNDVPLTSSMVGDALVGFFGNGSVGICVPDKQPGVFESIPNVMPPAPVGLYVPPAPVVAVDGLSDVKAIAIDQATARIASVDVLNKTFKRAEISGPEVAASVKHYANYYANYPPQTDKTGNLASRGTPRVVGAAGADRTDGTVYCSLSPTDPRAPLLLKVSETGSIVRRVRCTLPFDTHPNKFKIPHIVRLVGRQLLLGFPDGEIFVYDV